MGLFLGPLVFGFFVDRIFFPYLGLEYSHLRFHLHLRLHQIFPWGKLWVGENNSPRGRVSTNHLLKLPVYIGLGLVYHPVLVLKAPEFCAFFRYPVTGVIDAKLLVLY